MQSMNITFRHEVTGLSWASCRGTFTEDWKMKRVSAKFLPRFFTEDKQQKVVFCTYAIILLLYAESL